MATTTTPPDTGAATETGGPGRQMWIVLAVLVVVAIAVVGALLIAGSGSESEAELEAAALEELVAQERAVLDVYFAESNSTVYVDMYAEDDVTYIDPSSGGVLKDQAAKDYLLSFSGQIPPLAYEIVDPSVNLSGDTAIFTFNVEMFSDGAPVGAWNTTEIHQRTDGGWEMLHAHWSNPAPPPEG